jgi:hypothetical protein
MLCDEEGVSSRITVILMADGPEPAYSVSAMHPAAENRKCQCCHWCVMMVCLRYLF